MYKRLLAVFIASLFVISSVGAAGKKTVSKEESTVNGVINALNYGFSNDGQTLNDEVMERYIRYDYTTPIYFPTGCYCFSHSINFPDTLFVELAANAEWKLEAKGIEEYFITLRKGRTEGGYAFNSYLKGGYINANNKAKNGIGVYRTRHVVFEDFYLKNVLEKGIVTRTEEHADGQSFFRNILVENDYGIPGTVGIYDNAFDTHFDQIEVVNFETAYDTICGRFDQCIAWIRDSSILENSTFAVLRGHDITFVSPAVDTYRYGFKMVYNEPSHGVLVTDMLWITNGGVYTQALREKYPREMFWAHSDNGGFKVCGLKLNNEDNLAFSNIPLTKSSFLNVRMTSETDPYETIKYYRNDNEARTGTADKSTDFDKLIKGTYECNLKVGFGGKNYPSLYEAGILEVEAAGSMTIQKFMGEKTYAYRLNTGKGFGNWVIIK